ncbi:hypothetical protein L7F22_030493 [Adiantum nelumboides]|nr:hypothetical protein [Adiantum nelumboides]
MEDMELTIENSVRDSLSDPLSRLLHLLAKAISEARDVCDVTWALHSLAFLLYPQCFKKNAGNMIWTERHKKRKKVVYVPSFEDLWNKCATFILIHDMCRKEKKYGLPHLFGGYNSFSFLLSCHFSLVLTSLRFASSVNKQGRLFHKFKIEIMHELGRSSLVAAKSD